MAEPEKIPENSPLYDAPKPVVEAPVIEPEMVISPDTGEPTAVEHKETQVFTPTHKSVWEQFEKDGIPVPEDYKQGKFPEGKNEWDVIRDLWAENTDFETEAGAEQHDDDPFLENLRKLPKDQRAAYIKNYNDSQEFFTLPAKDGLKAWWQGQVQRDKDGNDVRKYEDKDIDTYLEKLSPIELDREWETTKGQAQELFNERYQGAATENTQQAQQRIVTENAKRLDIAKSTVNEIDAITEFNGVPITPEQKAQAKRNFILLSQKNPATGQPHLMSLLNDNKKLMRFVLADTLLDGDYINEYLTTQKENFKEILLNEKLDIVPKPKTGVIGKPTGVYKPEP